MFMMCVGQRSYFFCECDDDHRDLHGLTHAFPTRRSSDLSPVPSRITTESVLVATSARVYPASTADRAIGSDRKRPNRPLRRSRSEEHTSELQSLMRASYAVFCLKYKHQPQIEQHIPFISRA